MTTRILVTRKWPVAVETLIATRHDVQLNVDDVPMTADELADAICHHDVICPTVTDRITAEMLDQPDRAVRLLCNYGAGLDHIDLDACRRNGVTVTNTPDVLTDATAEIAILLMLMVARRAGEGAQELREGRWTGWRPTHMIGTQLTGKTLGLIGFGRIAQATALKARALGMTIAYHGRRRADPAVEQSVEARFEPDLTALLSSADIVSLHMPGGAATQGLIGAAELASMRSTGFLINTARGSVIDEAALAAALHAGTIAGAGLDVFVGEPDIAPALMDAPNLVMLPHLGSATREARTAMGMRALANLDAWLAEQSPPDLVV